MSFSFARCADPKYEKTSLEKMHDDLKQWSHVRKYKYFLCVCVFFIVDIDVIWCMSPLSSVSHLWFLKILPSCMLSMPVFDLLTSSHDLSTVTYDLYRLCHVVTCQLCLTSVIRLFYFMSVHNWSLVTHRCHLFESILLTRNDLTMKKCLYIVGIRWALAWCSNSLLIRTN